MINLKKHDNVADAVKEILQQEALKGNQDKIDANHNGKIDAQDFKILRGKKKMKEEAERTEDTLTGKLKAKKGDDVGPGSDGKSSKVKLKAEEVESLEEKNWIANAIKHPGAETAAAKKAGMSVQAYAQKHQHDSGKAGKRARLALTLKHMKEKFEEPILDELINEVMSKDATAGDYIHDFIHSDNPKFAGKSKAKRKEMALAAYYSKKNEEAVNEGLKDVAKKAFTALTGGSDKEHLDRLKKDMYGGSEVKYAAKTLVKHAKDPLGLKKEEVEQIDELSKDTLKSYRVNSIGRSGSFEKRGYEAAKKDGGAGNDKSDKLFNKADLVASARKRAQDKMRKEEFVEEGWDDMVKDAQEKVKSGPKPSGGSGKKEGSRYGGSKQKEKPEHEMKEAKNPMMDAGVGAEPNFSTDATKPMKVAQSMAKKSLTRMRNEMLGKTGTSE